MKSSLESKTIRPGLLAYSFYSSDRHPAAMAAPVKARPRLRPLLKTVLLLVLLLGLVRGFQAVVNHESNTNSPRAAQAALASGSHCSSAQGQTIIVSISQRHAWACQNHRLVYDTPVVTGMEQLAADRTPTGTYHIYAKQTNTTLTGSDSTGNWSDPVSYWMPFLDNQYGTYGFHDATWRPSSDFGHIDPNSSSASHGCVELPLAAAKWFYDWSQVGTTVDVQA